MAVSRSLIRGAAIGVVAGVLVFGLAQVIGLAPPGSRLVYVEGAVAGMVLGFLPRSRADFHAIGAALVGLAAVVFGIAVGWGWIEYSGIAGAAIAMMWTLAGEPSPPWQWNWFRWGGVLIPLLILVLLPLVIDGGTLGHDESAYGVKAKSWLEGTPDTGWSPHRGTGMSAYGYLVLAAGGTDAGLRLIGLVGVIGLAAAVWALGRSMASPRVAALAAIGVVAGPSILRRGTEYLSDVPAAALLVFCTVIVWREFTRRELPTYRLLWVVPLAWVAFYLRYQSILSLALIALVTVILWWAKIRRRPGPLVLVAGLGLAGLVPHAIDAIRLTGAPWGILTLSGQAGGRDFVGEGLVDYASQLTWSLAGFVGPIATAAAIWGLARCWGESDQRRRYLFLLVPASAQVLVLGLVVHGEPRFVFFPLALVVVAGAISVDDFLSREGSRSLAAVAIGLAMLLWGSLAVSVSLVRPSVEGRAQVNLPIELAALEVRSQSGEALCGVLTTLTPQVTYYSECVSHVFSTDLDPTSAVEALATDERFMILIEGGTRQPEGAALGGLIDLTEGPPVIIEGTLDAAVYRFAD